MNRIILILVEVIALAFIIGLFATKYIYPENDTKPEAIESKQLEKLQK